MKHLAIAFLMTGLGITPALSDDIPFAQPSNSPQRNAGQGSESLGDIMGLTQLRHIKLWYAGKAENWDLVTYELQQLNDTFARAAVQYVGIPVDTVAAVSPPLESLAEAAQEKNSGKFVSSFEVLTGACNSCHVAAGIPFVKIQTPTSSPFSDQDFSATKPR